MRPSLFRAGALSVVLASIACAESVTAPEDALPTTTATTTASSGSTSGAGGSGGDDGPCQTAEDCAAAGDACNVGTCINGECEKTPTNEGASCDDGKACTTGDTCQAGTCTGPKNPCPSSSPCHVGDCDLELDACVEVPGNDGVGCVDEDPCTLTGVCQAGTCAPGQPVDCSFLDGPCSVGECDARIGCIAVALNDGAPCEDGFFCTVDDACDGGICTGAPNTCPTGEDICLVATCNENADACVSVAGNDGAACDDGDACTAATTCSGGDCGGGQPANEGGACDDAKACTTGDVCAAGSCTGVPVLVCVAGDGCCPAGCTPDLDDDCGGVVYMTSSNGDPGFHAYDVETNTWATLASPPSQTHSQITTDGEVVYLMGSDNAIYAFDPDAQSWSFVQPGPGPITSQPIGFFKWTPSGFFYAKDGEPVLHRSSGPSWVSQVLPQPASCAGSWDEATNALYIRVFSGDGLMVYDVAGNTVTDSFPSQLGVPENSRTGSYHAGFFWVRDWFGPFRKIDVATGMVSQTSATPIDGHTATDVDPSTGLLYIGPYDTGSTFQVLDTATETLSTLASSPPVFNHSTIVFVK